MARVERLMPRARSADDDLIVEQLAMKSWFTIESVKKRTG